MTFGFGASIVRSRSAAAPVVVTAGLSLYLDPANAASYPGTGNDYFDLSGLSHNFTKLSGKFNNTPIKNWENGIFQSSNYLGGDTSFQVWIKTTQVGNGNGHFTLMHIMAAEVSGGTTNPTDFGFGIGQNAKLGFGTGGTDATVFSTASVNTGAWINVAATRAESTGEVKLYVNGSLDTSGSCAASAGNLNASNSVALGQGQDGGKNWVGETGSVLTYSTALSGAQILQNYNATKSYYGY